MMTSAMSELLAILKVLVFHVRERTRKNQLLYLMLELIAHMVMF